MPSATDDAGLVVDDIAVLAQEEGAYSAYAAAVRWEFSWVLERRIKAARRSVLQKL